MARADVGGVRHPPEKLGIGQPRSEFGVGVERRARARVRPQHLFHHARVGHHGRHHLLHRGVGEHLLELREHRVLRLGGSEPARAGVPNTRAAEHRRERIRTRVAAGPRGRRPRRRRRRTRRGVRRRGVRRRAFVAAPPAAGGFCANICAKGLSAVAAAPPPPPPRPDSPPPLNAFIIGSWTSWCILDRALKPPGCASTFANARSASRICSRMSSGLRAASKVRRNISGSFSAWFSSGFRSSTSRMRGSDCSIVRSMSGFCAIWSMASRA